MKTRTRYTLILIVGLGLGLSLWAWWRYQETPLATWHMINVNSAGLQGDAHLLTIGKQTVMIDGGYTSEAKKAVIPYLKKLGIGQIDYFFITHPHRDHYEGLAAIIGAGIPVRTVYYKMPKEGVQDCCYSKRHFLEHLEYARKHGAKLIQPKAGFKLELLNGSEIEILHAQEQNTLNGKQLDVNDLSLIMQWRIDGMTVLFTGDLNMPLGTYLTNDPRMRSDFLKMPHHGAESLAPNTFLDAVHADYVLVPGPETTWCNDRGARPRKWTIAKKIPTWVNGVDGNVTVEFKRREIVITPEHDTGRCKLKAFGQMVVPISRH